MKKRAPVLQPLNDAAPYVIKLRARERASSAAMHSYFVHMHSYGRMSLNAGDNWVRCTLDYCDIAAIGRINRPGRERRGAEMAASLACRSRCSSLLLRQFRVFRLSLSARTGVKAMQVAPGRFPFFSASMPMPWHWPRYLRRTWAQ